MAKKPLAISLDADRLTNLNSVTIKLIVDPVYNNWRLDKFLSAHPEVNSRAKAQVLIASGLVSTAGKKLGKASVRVSAHQMIEVILPTLQDGNVSALDLEVPVVFEDDDLIVVDKPSGLVVHPAPGHLNDTLVNVLKNKLSQFLDCDRPGIVHRLDKDTSGLLVVAKNEMARIKLIEQFRNRQVHRRYQAVVWGRPKLSQDSVVNHLLRAPWNRKIFTHWRGSPGASPQGKLAITHFDTLKSSGCFTWLNCRLETGRTHQIRVHLFESGVPLVGDPIYRVAQKQWRSAPVWFLQNHKDLRLMLHALELGFVHPTSQKLLRFEVPWPNETQAFFESSGLLE